MLFEAFLHTLKFQHFFSSLLFFHLLYSFSFGSSAVSLFLSHSLAHSSSRIPFRFFHYKNITRLNDVFLFLFVPLFIVWHIATFVLFCRQDEEKEKRFFFKLFVVCVQMVRVVLSLDSSKLRRNTSNHHSSINKKIKFKKQREQFA